MNANAHMNAHTNAHMNAHTNAHTNVLNNDYGCYIRRQGQPWNQARSHHRVALELFLEEEAQAQTQAQAQRQAHVQREARVYRIVVPHEDGGEFIGWFRRLNQAVCQYRDEYGQVVGIMMSSSGQVGFINRVVDP